MQEINEISLTYNKQNTTSLNTRNDIQQFNKVLTICWSVTIAKIPTIIYNEFVNSHEKGTYKYYFQTKIYYC